MPTYDIRNTSTGEEKEIIVSYSKMREMVESGEWEQIHKSPVTLVTHVGGTLRHTDDNFKDLLKNIKKHSGRGNTIRT